MAEQQQEIQFRYHRIKLYKSESLGSGSYGGVCRAKCDGLPCAAKIMHPTLFDLRDPGTASYLERFEGECRLLSLARHPNVMQYLATYRDSETRLPVLLMELCDESLCRFLERSPGPLPYHIELNISHDIALALVYLHSNSLIHRDLTANNVLMIAAVRAKVTDFGMSKLARVNPRVTPMTLCPGNLQYMSPEALEEPPSYTEKLDIFSFGVLLVQIMTRQFPDAGPRFQVVNDPRYPDGVVRISVPEMQRRSAHLKLISGTHPLKAMALNCLKGKERERPSAQQLSNSLSELKGAPQYAESKQQNQTGEGNGQEVGSLRRQVRDLQQRDQEQRQEIEQQEKAIIQYQQAMNNYQQRDLIQQHEINRARQEIEHFQQQDQMQRQEIQQQRQEIQQQRQQIEQAHLSHQQAVAQAQQLEQQLKGQRVLSEANRREIQQLQHTVEDQQRELQQMKLLPPQAATASAAEKDISKLRLEEGKKAPERMRRGAAVVDGNTVYINPGGSNKVYSCQISSGDQQWSTLPDSRYYYFSLAVIYSLLTSIGGCSDLYVGPCTNTLLSLTGEGRERQWSKVFPPMPTARITFASVTTEQTLVVAGGHDSSKRLDTVEVMNIPNKQWSTAIHMPHPFDQISATICGDQLYVGGGYCEGFEPSQSVLTCSLPDLLQPQSLGAKLRTLSLANKPGVWRHINELPVARSTLTTLGGHLVAIGGTDDSDNPTADVCRYDPQTDSWHVIMKMKTKRCHSLVAVLPEDRLIIVGGGDASWRSMDSVEIGSFPVSG